jgi:hypothetical protein
LKLGVHYRPFKVDTPLSLHEKLLNSDIWPEDVCVGKFFPAKASRLISVHLYAKENTPNFAAPTIANS